MPAETISLEEFILETMRTPTVDMRMPILDDCFRRLCLPDDLIERHIVFSGESYTRNLVCRTPRFDLLILCWRAGHVTTIHDHVESLNCTRVIHGSITERLFEASDETSGQTLVRLLETDAVEAGSCTGLDLGEIHQLENTSGQDVVTLHLYSKPLRDITVYDPEAGTTERVALRYTLEDEFG